MGSISEQTRGRKHIVNVYSKKGKGKRLEETFSFNDKGRVDRETLYKSNGNVLKETLFNYNDSNKVTRRKVSRNHKLRNVYEYNYNNYTQISSARTFYKDTIVPISSTVYEYTPANKTKSIVSYDKHKNI